MKISLDSDLWLPAFTQAISVLMDRAIVCLDDIQYDRPGGIVRICMQRREITGFKKSFLGETQTVYGQVMLPACLEIRQVESMEIQADERLAADFRSCFTLLFGLKVEGRQLYLGSVEEAQGKPLCQVFIQVSGASIELADLGGP